jgi:hypothetical protein
MELHSDDLTGVHARAGVNKQKAYQNWNTGRDNMHKRVLNGDI